MQCPHTTIIKNLCCICGIYMNEKVDTMKADGRVALLHNVPDLFVTKDLAKKISKNEREHLLMNKKLILIVDLDQTILHSSTIFVTDMRLIDIKEHQMRVDTILKDNKGDFLSYTHKNYFQYTFFRDNVKEFLQDIEPYYELHIFTMGTRDYVTPIINYLDPNGKLFGSRIKTRDECAVENNKYIELESIFPCTSDLVCILDDRLDVWMHSHNVLQIYPYKNSYANILEKEFCNKTEDELSFENLSIDDSTILPKMCRILKQVHSIFYKNFDPPNISTCTSKIIRKIQKSIFRGEIFFYVDIGMLKPINDNRQGDLSYKIKLMGGKICKNLSEKPDYTTHFTGMQCYIIADDNYCEKEKLDEAFNLLLSNYSQCNIKVVDSNWINMCYYRWKKVDESPYLTSFNRSNDNKNVSLKMNSLNECRKRKHTLIHNNNIESCCKETFTANNIAVVNKLEKLVKIIDTADNADQQILPSYYIHSSKDQSIFLTNLIPKANNINKNNEQYREDENISNLYKEEDIESMANELEKSLK